MTTVEIWGIQGALTLRNINHAEELAKTLLDTGYGVTIDGTEVRIEHRAGYDLVVWASGNREGESVLDLEA